MLWKLDSEHRVVECSSIIEWGEFLSSGDRIVEQTNLDTDIFVSTVFLGMDHRWDNSGPPLLFETMVFGLSAEDEDMVQRYSSWDDAVTGHKATVRKVKEIINGSAMGYNQSPYQGRDTPCRIGAVKKGE